MVTLNSKKQWDFLKKIVENKKIPQAMIFSGPPFLEKKKTALEFIKILNCEEQTFSVKPCQNCLACKLIEQGKHPDLILITPEKKDIQIDQIRELQRKLNITPSQLSDFKSVIIDKAERLNSYAQNCLLKTLEEPKGKVLLIFVTSYLESLFETIRSRCQILKFYPTAFSFQGLAHFQDIEKILDLKIWQRFSFCQRFLKEEEENSFESLDNFFITFENYFRAVFLKKLEIRNEVLNSFSLNLPKDYSFSEIKRIISLLEDMRVLTNTTNISKKLALENLMLNID